MNRGQSDFGRVYEEHVYRVYGFLAYRTSNRESAEDLTQATFERALRAWSRFDPRRGAEHTWLLAIARNVLIDHYRRDRSDRHEPIEDHELGTAPGPEETFVDDSELREALAQLGERERDVLTLRFGADLGGPDIAALMGLSLANVQQITSRSLRKLRELLDAEGHERVPDQSAARTQPQL